MSADPGRSGRGIGAWLATVLGVVLWANPVLADGNLSLESELFEVTVSNANAGLTSASLKSERYVRDGKPIDIVTTDDPNFLPLRFELEGADLKDLAFKAEQLGDGNIQLTWQGDGLAVTRKFEAGAGPYQLWITTRIRNLGDAPRKLAPRIGTHHYVEIASEQAAIPLLPVRPPSMSNALCLHAEDIEREPGPELTQPLIFKGGVRFVGVENVHFLNAVAPEETLGQTCTMSSSERGRDPAGDPLGTLYSTTLTYPAMELGAGQVHVYRDLAYMGPKTPRELARAGHSLRQAIDTGWFTTLAETLSWLLRAIYDVVGNWGLAIILLTVMVKLVLYPLTAKQMQSMARMKELKPEMDRLNELYKDDREKKGAAVMELYRKKKVNPMAGCFPVLLQLPIWFSLYTSLSSNVELFHAPFFLWWTDLSSPDPYFTLPIGLGGLMFLQQKMMPAASADPLQQKMMMYMMPAMITSFMLFLPAGLCLYMLTNSVLSIAQQKFIEVQLAKMAPTTDQANNDDNDDGDSDDEQDDDASQNDSSASVKRNRPTKAQRKARRGRK